MSHFFLAISYLKAEPGSYTVPSLPNFGNWGQNLYSPRCAARISPQNPKQRDLLSIQHNLLKILDIFSADQEK
jgi:hypothetical protein